MKYKLQSPIFYKWYEKKFWTQLWRILTSPVVREETLSLDTNIAFFLVPRLKLFKKINNEHAFGGSPTGLTMKQWNTILDKMILAFELQTSEQAYLLNKKQVKQQEEGLLLFAKYYGYLWW